MAHWEPKEMTFPFLFILEVPGRSEESVTVEYPCAWITQEGQMHCKLLHWLRAEALSLIEWSSVPGSPRRSVSLSEHRAWDHLGRWSGRAQLTRCQDRGPNHFLDEFRGIGVLREFTLMCTIPVDDSGRWSGPSRLTRGQRGDLPLPLMSRGAGET